MYIEYTDIMYEIDMIDDILYDWSDSTMSSMLQVLYECLVAKYTSVCYTRMPQSLPSISVLFGNTTLWESTRLIPISFDR